jgi:hypothetical protein
MTDADQKTPEPDVTMFWLRSERSSAAPDPYGDRIYADAKLAAAAHGMTLPSVTVDEIVVSCRGDGPVVRVRGERIDPRSAFFHTKLMSWPIYAVDLWRELTTCLLLEQAGFCVTVPALHSIINNDKLFTLAQDFADGIDPIPTVRVCTRAYYPGLIDFTALGLEFPAVVKPVDWGGGNAVFLVDGPARLDSVLTLAGAAEMTMVIQPWLGRETVDCRIYCLDGEPVRASERRISASGSVAGNVTQGGSSRMIPVPQNLRESAALVARDLGLPYVCVDFLGADGRFWFSEIEVDGGTTAGGPELNALRFGAYRGHFERFLAVGGRTGQSGHEALRRWRYVP